MRLFRDGINVKDGLQIEKCFKVLGIRVKANDNIITRNKEKPQP